MNFCGRYLLYIVGRRDEFVCSFSGDILNLVKYEYVSTSHSQMNNGELDLSKILLFFMTEEGYGLHSLPSPPPSYVYPHRYAMML